jgi:hypothetical protein
MPLTSAEKKLAAAIGFDVDVCDIVKQQTGRTLHRLTAFTEDYKPQKTDGLSVEVGREDVEPLIALLQPRISKRGYRAFWSETYESNGAKKSEEIAVLKTTDDYAIISLRRSSGGNYDVSTGDLIKKLKEWKKRCRFHIAGAGGAWVAIQFESLPKNLCAFAEEMYDFCPDTVEQGVGLMNEGDDPAAFAAARKLCPKLSVKMQKKLDQQTSQIAQMKLPPQFREMLNQMEKPGAGGFTTPTDMGIRLLAYHLKKSSQLFLWWD